MSQNQSSYFIFENRIQKLLETLFVVIHSRTQIRNHFILPTLACTKKFQKFCLPSQVLFLIVRGYTSIGDSFFYRTRSMDDFRTDRRKFVPSLISFCSSIWDQLLCSFPSAQGRFRNP